MQIAIIGLGYVGLPLAVAFGKKYEVWGFDINPHRINELESGYDRTHEVSNETLQQAQFLQFTIARISQRLYFILIGSILLNPIISGTQRKCSRNISGWNTVLATS